MAKAQTPGAELAIPTRSSSDLATLDEFDQILLGLADAPEVVDDPEQISREILMQLLGAKSDEELTNFGNATGWRELENQPVFLDGFRWRPSEYEEGAPVYVIVNAIHAETGEVLILTTGSGNVLAQLSNLARRGQLPSPTAWRIVKAAKQTANGYYPLHLEKVPEAAREIAAAPAPTPEEA